VGVEVAFPKATGLIKRKVVYQEFVSLCGVGFARFDAKSQKRFDAERRREGEREREIR
jgi:hypothetical protein